MGIKRMGDFSRLEILNDVNGIGFACVHLFILCLKIDEENRKKDAGVEIKDMSPEIEAECLAYVNFLKEKDDSDTRWCRYLRNFLEIDESEIVRKRICQAINGLKGPSISDQLNRLRSLSGGAKSGELLSIEELKKIYGEVDISEPKTLLNLVLDEGKIDYNAKDIIYRK